MSKNLLDSISLVTKIVVDSSDFKSLGFFGAVDATTNPSLIIKSINNDIYNGFVKEVSKKYLNLSNEDLAREVIVSFAEEILKVIPGRVSIEIDPAVAFDQKKTETEAYKIVESCQFRRISLKRILVKIPATWEGILAAKELERQNIKCNLTLVFSDIQALACAESGATLISPFVGRISDWWSNKGLVWELSDEDPGVKFVKAVYFYLKKKQYKTEIMAASFRSVDQILSLAGLDLITISPNLLSTLMKLPPKECLTEWTEDLINSNSQAFEYVKATTVGSQASFLELLGDNEMANENLTKGIDIFRRDGKKLIELIEAE